MAASNSRSRSTRPVRSSRNTVKNYQEETSSDDMNDLPRSERTPFSLRSGSTQMPRSYREESTDASFDAPVEDQELGSSVAVSREEQSLVSKSMPSSRPPRQPQPRRTENPKPKQRKRSTKPRSQVGGASLKRAKTDEGHTIILGSGIIPPWQTLPYHILLDIFLRASYPLLDEERSDRNDSVKWLKNIALLCQSFREPALTALFRCPPLLPAFKTHHLLRLLSQPVESLSLNYSSKIKILNVEAEPLLLYKSGPLLGYFDLTKLIEKTPQVHTIRLYHREDYTIIPPWHNAISKWTYPDSIFSAIKDSGILLRSWDWNHRFLSDKDIEFMSLQHREPAFRGLRELRLLHFNASDMDRLSNNRALLVNALRLLTQIQRVEFLQCSVVDKELLTPLPSAICSITLSKCDAMTSEDLTAFLDSHGANLQELILEHNRQLSMSFIQSLGQTCPRLKIFKMDVSMHDGSSFRDFEPHFPVLLAQTEVPTWPAQLQEIELIQLRKWDDVTAEVFFTSLVNAAPDLRDLRKLGISAILKIGWRDRATFREKWISRLERVFLRRSSPPNPNLRSIRARQLKSGNLPSLKEDAEENQIDETHQWTAEIGSSAITKRQSTRLAYQTSIEAIQPTVDQLQRSSPFDNDMIQAMCDVVSIRIDNQRPTEMQYNENDFLDDELSGDEDWAGRS